MSDLSFSVQLRLLTEQFNNGANAARDRFGMLQQSIARNVKQMNTDTERASTMLGELGNVSIDQLTAQIRTTADQLRQMGAGARLSGEQLQEALRTAAQHVSKLEQDLTLARYAAKQLGETDASPEQLEQAAAKVAKLEQELNEAKSASVSLSNELAGAMNRASNTADSARNSIYRITNIRVPETIRADIDAISRSLVDFQNNSGRPAAEIERVTRAAQEQIKKLEAELRGAEQQIDRTDASTKKLGGGTNALSGSVSKANAAFGGLQGMLASLGMAVGAAEIIAMADAFVMLEARIKIATGEGVNFVSGFEGVKKIAAETYSSLENTGELFARITQAAKEMGLAQDETLAVTKTINEAIKLSGGSVESADAAITQLIQGLQSGVVRGEEFNSIMEQSPRLAQAMADGLGVTRGELRALAGEGKLTSEVVIKAIQSQSEAIQKEFDTLPLTLGNSVILLKNTFFELIGDINTMVNQSGRLAAGVKSISDSLKDLDPTTVGAVEYYFDSVLTTFGSLFSALKDVGDAFNDVIEISLGLERTEESVGLLTRDLQAVNVGLGTISDGLKGIAILSNSVFGSVSYITAAILEGYAALKGQTSERAAELYQLADELHAKAEQQALDFESSTVAAWDDVTKTAQTRLDETVAATQKAYDDMKTAGKVSYEAMQEQFVKLAEAKIKANDMMISDDLRLELAQQDLTASVTEAGEIIIESAQGVQAEYTEVGNSFAEVAAKAISTGKSVSESLAEAVPKAQTIGAVDDIINSLTALSNQGLITGQEVAEGINIANERYKEIENNFARYAARTLKENDGIVTSELEKAAALQGLAVQADETGNVIVTQLDRATVSSGRTKEQIQDLADSVGIGLSKEFRKTAETVTEIDGAFKDLTEAGYDARTALTDALTQMTEKAKNTTELNDVIIMWQDLGEQGRLTGEDLAAGLDLASERLDALTDGVNSVNEAYKVLGLTTREEAAKQAETYTQAYDLVLKSGTATTGQLEEGFKKYAKSAIAANGDVVDSTIRNQAAQRGLTVAVDESGRVTFESMKKAEEVTAKARQPVERLHSSYDSLSSGAGRAGDSMVRSAERAMSAYDKLQLKIKQLKEAQELASADETMNNLRIYGTEKAPTEGNQFGSRLAVENFLKSQGLSEAAAIEEARKLYARQGTTDGALNTGKLQGFRDGQMMTAADIDRYKSASVYLAEIAAKARQLERQRDDYSAARTATASITAQEYGRFDSAPATTKRYEVEFKLGNTTATTEINDNQTAALEAILRTLQESKAISGF